MQATRWKHRPSRSSTCPNLRRNLRETRFERQLMAFLLSSAPAVEQVVLVTRWKKREELRVDRGDEHVERWRSSKRRCLITACPSSKDRSQNPVHTRLYHARRVIRPPSRSETVKQMDLSARPCLVLSVKNFATL